MSVDNNCLVLVHPNYVMMPDSYRLNLESAIEDANSRQIPVVGMLDDIKKRDSFFEQINGQIDLSSPDAYVEPDILLAHIKHRYGISPEELYAVIGGMNYRGCVASFANRTFLDYDGPKPLWKGRDGVHASVKAMWAVIDIDICKHTL